MNVEFRGVLVEICFGEELYKDLLQGDYREERFMVLGKKAGIPQKKIEKMIEDKKVSLARIRIIFSLICMICCKQ